MIQVVAAVAAAVAAAAAPAAAFPLCCFFTELQREFQECSFELTEKRAEEETMAISFALHKGQKI